MFNLQCEKNGQDLSEITKEILKSALTLIEHGVMTEDEVIETLRCIAEEKRHRTLTMGKTRKAAHNG